MKTQIEKMIILVIASFFVNVGVSFAHDWQGWQHEARGNTNGYYKKRYDDRPDKYEKHFYGYRNPWHGSRPYHKRDHYRREFYRHDRFHHYNRRYPVRSTFFFGFFVH